MHITEKKPHAIQGHQGVGCGGHQDGAPQCTAVFVRSRVQGSRVTCNRDVIIRSEQAVEQLN